MLVLDITRNTGQIGRTIFGALVVLSLLMVQQAQAFKPAVHRNIVREALQVFEVKAPDGEDLYFSFEAVKELQKSTVNVDNVNPYAGKAEWWDDRAHCDNERLEECSQRMKDRIESIRNNAENRSGSMLRQLLGEGLHTLQDFYAHSNWVNNPGPARTTPHPDLGVKIVPSLGPRIVTCEPYPNTLAGAGLTEITTGYFDVYHPFEVPDGKCLHGYQLAFGIHKDEFGRPFFTQARDVAVQATEDYVARVISQLRTKYGDDFGPILKLLNVRGSLGFVIDDTASMGPTLSGVKNSVVRIVNRVKDIPLVSPEEYLLVRFGDPDVGAPFITEDPNALLAGVNALDPVGGDDCPEMSVTAVMRAIEAAKFGSRIHVFTDASSKDGNLKESVKASAKAKHIFIKFAVTGSCSPIDPVYEEIARDTGGQLVVLENTATAVENYFAIVEPELTGDLEPLLLLKRALGESADNSYIKVDSTMTSLVVNVNMETKGVIRFFRPNDTEVMPGDPDATINELPYGRVINMSAPTAGSWRLNISGSSGVAYTIVAQGNTPLRFYSFDFVELKGKPGHEGLFPIDGDPIVGVGTTAVASLFGLFSNASFVLAAEDGRILQRPILEQGNAEADQEDFVGTVEPPTERFRVYVMGKDTNGFSFSRVYPPMFLAQKIQVETMAMACDQEMYAGSQFRALYRVTNRGDTAGDFDISASPSYGSVSRISQPEVALEPGASSEIEVLLDVPADIDDGSVVYVTLTATDAAAPAAANTAFVSRLAQSAITSTGNGDGGGGGSGGGCFIYSIH